MNIEHVPPQDSFEDHIHPYSLQNPHKISSRLRIKQSPELLTQSSNEKSDAKNSETLFTSATIATNCFDETRATVRNHHKYHTTLGFSDRKSTLFEESTLSKPLEEFNKNSPSRFAQIDTTNCDNTLKDICLEIQCPDVDIISQVNLQEEIPLENVGSLLAINEETASHTQAVPQRPTNNSRPRRQNASRQQDPAPEPAPASRSEQLSEIEAKLYLRRSIAFFVAMSSISLFILLLTNRRSMAKGVFITLYVYLCYYIFENTKLRRYPQRAQWRLREDVLSSIEAISAIVFFVCIHLKLKHILPTSMIATIPIFIGATIRLWKSIIPNKVRRRRIIITRFCYAIQALLITMKIDGYSHWGWKIVFTPLWVYFGIMMCFYVVIISIFVVKLTIFVNPRQGVNDEINSLTQFLGMFWSCLYYGLNFVAFIALSGMAKAFKPAEESFDLLRSAAFMGLYFNFVLVVYTVLGFKRLSGYLRIYNLIQNALIGVGLSQEEKLSENKMESLVEKKECHFVMQSYTYFIPLKNILLYKNKERLEKIKNKLSNLKLAKILQKKLKYTKPQGLRCARRLPKLAANLGRRFSKSNPLDQLSISLPDCASKFEDTLKQDMLSIDIENTKQNCAKRHFSVTDLDDFNAMETQADHVVEEELLCYVCCERKPNAILENCGHGGICYECAVSVMNKRNRCMQCRNPVETILKIDPKLKLFDIVKGIESTKVLKRNSS